MSSSEHLYNLYKPSLSFVDLRMLSCISARVLLCHLLCATTEVFPSESPSSRTDAVMLDNWISHTFGKKREKWVRSR